MVYELKARKKVKPGGYRKHNKCQGILQLCVSDLFSVFQGVFHIYITEKEYIWSA